MFTGIHTNVHITLHLKAGNAISMQQLICSSQRRPILHLVQWEIKHKKSKKGAGPQPIKSVIIQALIGNFVLCYVKTKQDTVPELIG